MLDVLVKEFKSAAGEDDKQEVYAKIEEEAANLNGSLARLFLYYYYYLYFIIYIHALVTSRF